MHALESRLLMAVHEPLNGDQLQTAINNAQLGDTIILKAGETYVTSTTGGHGNGFTLRNMTTGTGWITIQSSNLDKLPGPGVRVSPEDSANMPKMTTRGGNVQVVKTDSASHHYQFIGIEFVGPANNSSLTTLIELGNDAQTTVAQVPKYFNFDRCYVRPNTSPQTIRRAFGVHSQYVDIVNSYVEDIHEGSDSNAIAGWNGLGNYNIINNHLEGAGENIMFGGATNRMPVPASDVLIRGNHVVKPLHWRTGSRGYTATVKNLFELKHGARFLVEDNIFENCWVSGQTGVAIVLKLGDYNVSPQNVTEDINFRNNIVRHANGAIALQGRDYSSGSPEGLVRRIAISNNVFDDINGKWGASGTGGGTFNIYITQGPKDVTIDHNTFFNGSTAIEVDESNDPISDGPTDTPGYAASNFKFRNNIVDHNTYGVRSPSGTGNATFNEYFIDAGHEFNKNVLVNTPWGNRNSYTLRPNNYIVARSDNADLWPTIGFVDMPNGNYRLAPSSVYNNAGTDGADIGANIDLLPVEFAYMVGATLNVRFDLIDNAPRPITLDANGSSFTATYDGTVLNFTGVTAINVVGTSGDDKLLLDGTTAVPMTITSGGGAGDEIDVINGAGESWTFQNNIGGATRNVAVDVAAGATAIFNATQRLRRLDVAGKATLVQGGGKVIVTKALAASGQLDLKDNDLLLDFTGSPDPLGSFNGTSYSGVLGLIASGYNFAAQDGNGLVTTTEQALGGVTSLGASRATDVYGIAAGETTVYEGETINGSTLIVKYTYAGDVNLDGVVDGSDYGTLDNWIQFPGTDGYHNGDVNYDGVIDGADYGALDNSIQLQGDPL